MGCLHAATEKYIMNQNAHRILILDFGSQYTQLIARRIRELNIYCEIFPCDMSENDIRNFNPAGIILSGSPESTTQQKTPRAPEIVFKLGCPVLGICYGMQTMALQLGGQVQSSEQREFGYAQLTIHGHSQLFDSIEDRINEKNQSQLDVWMSHGDQVLSLPTNFKIIAETKNTPIAAMADVAKHLYGLQFHPEVTHTKQGSRILERFVHTICRCEKTWTPKNILEETIAKLREQIGSDEVILGLSGGVDSSVVAALLHKAIGKQLSCVFVDHGMLRKNESEEVVRVLGEHFGISILPVDAKESFLNALKNISDPEEKRKICGELFIQEFDKAANEKTNVKWLAQGTIYPDVIESGSAAFGKAHTIKTHHNVGGLPSFMRLKLIEPLRYLFKDEVRQLGLEAGLPQELIYRHPFPGPGLAVRILGEIKKEYIDILQQADAIFIEELRQNNYYDKVSQAFAVFLPIKSVGVLGDARQYAYVIALRAVETTDFMTARWAHLPHELLDKISHRIINEVSGISRVVYDISGKPPATIEWE
jgi:GMP synthase (glutamine-hydrolysing)